jgi:hypothetical protein
MGLSRIGRYLMDYVFYLCFITTLRSNLPFVMFHKEKIKGISCKHAYDVLYFEV